MKYDDTYTEALFKQVQALNKENETLKEKIKYLEEDINNLEMVLSLLNPEIENETLH